MSDVYVQNFNEFLTEVAKSGNTIICPSNAIWDLNEIDPLNTIQLISVKSDVVGNGTTIKNFRGNRISIAGKLTIDQLHMENFYFGSNKPFDVPNNYTSYITRSRISCLLGPDVEIFLSNMVPTQCAINVSFQRSGENDIRWTYDSGGAYGRYNRIKANCPNAAVLNDGRWYISDSELIINAPLATRMYRNLLYNCTIRGNLQSLTSSAASQAERDFNVITGVSDSYPTYAEGGMLVKVSDAQMRDVEYLQSIGFQIGSGA